MSLFIQILFRILLFWPLPHLDPDHHRLLPDEGRMYLTAPDFSSLVSLSLLHIAASRSDWLETQVRSKPPNVPWEQNAKLPMVPKRRNSVWPRPIWPHLLPPALLFNQPRFQTLQGVALLRKALESILLSEHFIINHRINFFHITDFFFSSFLLTTCKLVKGAVSLLLVRHFWAGMTLHTRPVPIFNLGKIELVQNKSLKKNVKYERNTFSFKVFHLIRKTRNQMKPFPALCKLCLRKKYARAVQESLPLFLVPFDISSSTKQLIRALKANHLGKCFWFFF